MVKPEINKVEVDMVPLIDIISLLLMFLIIVGDTAANASNIVMKLPRADQALTEKELKERKINTAGRIIVQLKEKDGKFMAVVNNRSYDLLAGGNNKTLIAYLQEQVQESITRGDATKAVDGAVSTPVKLRIPEATPMADVERVVMSLAQVGLVNVQYAAEPYFH